MKTYGVIMAGGGGTRFWPLSRRAVPKQFLNLSGKDILLNETIDRLCGVTAQEDIFVVTNARHAQYTCDAVQGRVARDHILAEPAARNTAACIGYAAMEILKKYGDGVMCILPSDHTVRDEEAFRQTLRLAADTAQETDALVTVGIRPDFPATGYGYIQYEEQPGRPYCAVREFVEKPDRETAEDYLAAGNYAWNSGMFIWKASVILAWFQKLLPDIYGCLEQIGETMGTEREAEAIAGIYPSIPKISVDYGIMERASGVLMLQGGFGWNDVGSWDVLGALYDRDASGNVVHGEHVGVDTKNCILYAQDKLIATIGVEGLVVAETPDAVLVCRAQDSQRVKEIVEKLEQEGKEKYL